MNYLPADPKVPLNLEFAGRLGVFTEEGSLCEPGPGPSTLLGRR
jgi:hypothetical protein